ncbi:MAG: alpha/beta hydrolase [Phycisphaerales bacterium]|nr:alpha/beta hydrolase [Phycisphaerales bacterium]
MVHYISVANSKPAKPAIVFVHGWACDHTSWDDQMRGLANSGFPLIALDLPGHGKSEMPRRQNFSMDRFADAVAAVMDDAGMKSAILVGHSNGTAVIRQFYRRYPKRTLALVVVDGPLRSQFPDPKAAEPFLNMLRADDVLEQVDKMMSPALQSMHDPNKRDRIHATMMATDRRTMLGALEAALDPAIWPSPPDAIDTPLLVILAQSPFWDADYEKFVRSIARNLNYQVWPGVSHFLMMDDSERFNHALLEFAQSLSNSQ